MSGWDIRKSNALSAAPAEASKDIVAPAKKQNLGRSL